MSEHLQSRYWLYRRIDEYEIDDLKDFRKVTRKSEALDRLDELSYQAGISCGMRE